MARPSRDQILGWKISLFFAAAGLWLLGVWREDERVTGVALILMIAALLLRFLPRREE